MEEIILNILKEYGISLPIYIIGPIIFIVIYIKYISPIIKYVYISIKSHFNRVSQLLDTTEQFKNNGGSTLRDKIDIINSNVSLLLDSFHILNNKLYSICTFIGELDNGAAFFETDSEGNCVFITGRWHELTGLLAEEAYGNGWIQGVYLEDRNMVYESWKTCIEQQREFILSYRMFNPLINKIIKVKCHAKKVVNSKNEIVKYIGAVYVIDETEF